MTFGLRFRFQLPEVRLSPRKSHHLQFDSWVLIPKLLLACHTFSTDFFRIACPIEPAMKTRKNIIFGSLYKVSSKNSLCKCFLNATIEHCSRCQLSINPLSLGRLFFYLAQSNNYAHCILHALSTLKSWKRRRKYTLLSPLLYFALRHSAPNIYCG